jgi:hypothetical protein
MFMPFSIRSLNLPPAILPTKSNIDVAAGS